MGSNPTLSANEIKHLQHAQSPFRGAFVLWHGGGNFGGRLDRPDVALKAVHFVSQPSSFCAHSLTLTVSRLVKLAAIFDCSLEELVLEASTGLNDQARHIANLMDGLGTSDRDEVAKIVESVCAVAHKKYKKQPTK